MPGGRRRSRLWRWGRRFEFWRGLLFDRLLEGLEQRLKATLRRDRSGRFFTGLLNLRLRLRRQLQTRVRLQLRLRLRLPVWLRLRFGLRFGRAFRMWLGFRLGFGFRLRLRLRLFDVRQLLYVRHSGFDPGPDVGSRLYGLDH